MHGGWLIIFQRLETILGIRKKLAVICHLWMFWDRLFFSGRFQNKWALLQCIVHTAAMLLSFQTAKCKNYIVLPAVWTFSSLPNIKLCTARCIRQKNQDNRQRSGFICHCYPCFFSGTQICGCSCKQILKICV